VAQTILSVLLRTSSRQAQPSHSEECCANEKLYPRQSRSKVARTILSVLLRPLTPPTAISSSDESAAYLPASLSQHRNSQLNTGSRDACLPRPLSPTAIEPCAKKRRELAGKLPTMANCTTQSSQFIFTKSLATRLCNAPACARLRAPGRALSRLLHPIRNPANGVQIRIDLSIISIEPIQETFRYFRPSVMNSRSRCPFIHFMNWTEKRSGGIFHSSKMASIGPSKIGCVFVRVLSGVRLSHLAMAFGRCVSFSMRENGILFDTPFAPVLFHSHTLVAIKTLRSFPGGRSRAEQ
jgi:hypothetical protein